MKVLSTELHGMFNWPAPVTVDRGLRYRVLKAKEACMAPPLSCSCTYCIFFQFYVLLSLRFGEINSPSTPGTHTYPLIWSTILKFPNAFSIKKKSSRDSSLMGSYSTGYQPVRPQFLPDLHFLWQPPLCPNSRQAMMCWGKLKARSCLI